MPIYGKGLWPSKYGSGTCVWTLIFTWHTVYHRPVSPNQAREGASLWSPDSLILHIFRYYPVFQCCTPLCDTKGQCQTLNNYILFLSELWAVQIRMEAIMTFYPSVFPCWCVPSLLLVLFRHLEAVRDPTPGRGTVAPLCRHSFMYFSPRLRLVGVVYQLLWPPKDYYVSITPRTLRNSYIWKICVVLYYSELSIIFR